MRVLFLNQYYPPDVSATAYLLGELTEDLARRHEVWVVAGHPSYNPEGGQLAPTGVHIRRSWSTAFSRRTMAGRLLNYGTFIVGSALNCIRVPRPDVVVSMTDPPVIGLVGLLAARFFRCHFVQICADLFPEISLALGRADNPGVVSLWRKVNRMVRDRADRIIAVGRDMRDHLHAQGVPAEKLLFLPNWANDITVPTSIAARVRDEMGWRERFVVMHAGNMGLAQGIPMIVDAAAKLQSEQAIVVVFVGDGAVKAQMMNRVRQLGLENVQFLDYRPKKEALEILAAADLHLISLAPSVSGYAVPSKVYGILALGKPFIAAVDEDSEVGRIVSETGAGMRVEAGDAAGLANAIRRCINDPAMADMGRRGRIEFEAKYRREVLTDQYRAVLESVADAKSDPP